MRKFLAMFSCVGLSCFVVASPALAGGGLWVAGGTSPYLWDDPANWEFGVPQEDFFGGADPVYITFAGAGETNGPIIEDGIAAVAGTTILGWSDNWVNNAGDTVTMTMTGGTLSTTSDFWIGKNDPVGGVYNPLTGPGILDISGGDLSLGPNGHLVVGQAAAGTINQTGGSMTAWRLVLDWYGDDASPPGGSVPSTYNLHGGVLEVTDDLAPIHLRQQALIDIANGGIMKLAGDHQAEVLGGIASDQITAYGGSGAVLYDFDVTNPGLTTVWAELAATEDADFDTDNDVDGNDFLIWQRGSGIPVGGGATLADGDANGDGGVNGADLSIWQTQFGTTSASLAAVPEPATMLLLCLGGLLLVIRSGRNPSRA